MKFIKLNDGSDNEIESHIKEMIGEYVFFTQGDSFIGKLISVDSTGGVNTAEPFGYPKKTYWPILTLGNVFHLKSSFYFSKDYLDPFEKNDNVEFILPRGTSWKRILNEAERISENKYEQIKIKTIKGVYHSKLIDSYEDGSLRIL